MRIVFFFMILSVIGCGKSPFLKEPKATEVTKVDTFETNVKSIDQLSKIEVKWITSINSFDEAQAFVFFYKNNKLYDPSNLADSDFYLWMESMGHGSSPITVKKLETGVYLLTEVYFSMTGDWQLKINIKEVNQTIIFDYFLVE